MIERQVNEVRLAVNFDRDLVADKSEILAQFLQEGRAVKQNFILQIFFALMVFKLDKIKVVGILKYTLWTGRRKLGFEKIL